MKQIKFLVVLLLILIPLTILTGCSSGKYDEAMELYEQGRYDEAKEIFSELGDYEDSADMASYLEGITLFSNGELEKASGIFKELPNDFFDVKKYWNAINSLKPYVGTWKSTDSFLVNGEWVDNDITLTIAPPFSISDTSQYSDCDWSVRGNARMEVRQMVGGWETSTFTVTGNELLSHLTSDNGETQLSGIHLKNENTGKTISYSRRGYYSTISISVERDGLSVTEVPCSLDWQTVYYDGRTFELY